MRQKFTQAQASKLTMTVYKSALNFETAMKTANSIVPLNPVLQFFVAYPSIILKDSKYILTSVGMKFQAASQGAFACTTCR